VDGFEITELPLISLVYTILGGLAIARIGVHENAGKRRVLLTLVSSLLKLILGRSNACTVRSSIPWAQQSEEPVTNHLDPVLIHCGMTESLEQIMSIRK